MEFKMDFQPDRVIIGGDFMDLRALRKGASEEDCAESIRPDFEKGIQILNDAEPTDVLLGNHDDRLWQVARAYLLKLMIPDKKKEIFIKKHIDP